MPPADATPPTPTDHRRVTFHYLASCEDRGEWIVGRADTGTYIAVPPEGALAIRLLTDGLTIDEARHSIRRETGRPLAVGAFVDSLTKLGFVRSVDGRNIPCAPPPPGTFPKIRPEHVRWTLSPILHAALLLLGTAGLLLLVAEPQLLPKWQDLLWSDRGSFVLLGQAALAWILLFLHELAHLLTARAAGVPGTMRLGTRLQYLVVQTDISGVWHCERRIRYTVYLAGIELNLAIAGGFVLAQTLTGPSALARLVVITELMAVTTELMVHMRTDVYFLLQDLFSCRNLYGDAVAYTRHLLTHSLGQRGPSPLTRLRPTERHVIRAYSLFMVVGTTASLYLAYLVMSKVVLVLLARSVHNLATAPDLISALDALTTITILAFGQAMWIRAWTRQHSPKLLRLVKTLR